MDLEWVNRSIRGTNRKGEPGIARIHPISSFILVVQALSLDCERRHNPIKVNPNHQVREEWINKSDT